MQFVNFAKALACKEAHGPNIVVKRDFIVTLDKSQDVIEDAISLGGSPPLGKV